MKVGHFWIFAETLIFNVIYSLFFKVSPRVYAPSRLTYPLLSDNTTSAIGFMFPTILTTAAPAFYSTITSPELAKSRRAKDTAFLQVINSAVSSRNGNYSDFYQWLGSEVS
jgi:hypothetical protein